MIFLSISLSRLPYASLLPDGLRGVLSLDPIEVNLSCVCDMRTLEDFSAMPQSNNILITLRSVFFLVGGSKCKIAVIGQLELDLVWT